MTHKQAIWASKHDWFIDARYHKAFDGYSVLVKDYVPNDATGQYELWERRFTDYQELREWAGY